MRILLMLATILAAALQSTSSQARPTRLVLTSDWEVNQTYRYERVKEGRKKGKSVGRSRTPLEVKVLERIKD